MANKTAATSKSVNQHIASIEPSDRRADCSALKELMQSVTNSPAKMWGEKIVGFDSYHYRYDSGREGDWCLTGFASGARDISIYLMASAPDHPGLLSKLGRHKMGKACLKIRRLADIELPILRQLVASSVREVRRRYPEQ
ncbi:MAG: DUF1801 domain-containing protein [Burkholderiaceae bacterium]